MSWTDSLSVLAFVILAIALARMLVEPRVAG
jgi:hypothetical protein